MRGHFRYLSFKTFSMTPRTPQCEAFCPLLLSSEHSEVPEDSQPPTFPSVGLHRHTRPKWGCDKTSESNVEKQVAALNNTLINFFKGNSHDPASSSSSTIFGACQLCKGGDHMATTCPRLNEAQPKCAKCNMPHRTGNCGIKCTFYIGLGHSEDKC
jgi:hypothetical protein